MIEELRSLLDDLKSKSGADVIAVISRNGIPIVFNGIEGGQIDTFATLSATILGASEVIYSGLGKEKPKTVIANSPGGTFIAVPLSSKTLLTVIGNVPKEELLGSVEQAMDSIKEVLSHGA